MTQEPKDLIPVFNGRRNLTILDTMNPVLHFGPSKIYPQQFHIKVFSNKAETLEQVVEKIEAKETEIYDHFMSLNNVHFTTCRQYWKRFETDSEEVIYQATVSATHVHIISALDEFNYLHLKA